METNLHFVVTLVTGGTVTQEIKCPTEAVDTAINQLLAQYSQVGLLKKESGKYTLTPASQIALVECTTSDVLLVQATPGDVSRVAAAASTLKRIK